MRQAPTRGDSANAAREGALTPGSVHRSRSRGDPVVPAAVAAELSRQEIATRLYVSPYTVKAGARTNDDKLDAHSRTAAVARARQLGILPPG